MPKHNKLIFCKGIVTSSDSEPVTNMKVQVFDKTESIFGESKTDKKGRFYMHILPSPKKQWSRENLLIRVVDGNQNQISASNALHFDQIDDIRLIVDSNRAGGSKPVVKVSNYKSGSLADPGMLKSIQNAIAMNVQPGSTMYQSYLSVAACPMPPLFREDWVLDLAWGVLSGDTTAGIDLRDRLLGVLVRELKNEGLEVQIERFIKKISTSVSESGHNFAPLNRHELLKAAEHFSSDAHRLKSLASQPKPNMNWPAYSNSIDNSQSRTSPPVNDGIGKGLSADRVMPLSMAILSIANSPKERSVLFAAQELGLAGSSRINDFHIAANRSLETGEPEHFHSMLLHAGFECGPDDGPMRDPFGGIERPDIPGGSFQPPIRNPELVECIAKGAPLIPVGLPRIRPALEEITPSNVCPGDELTLHGSNFINPTVFFASGTNQTVSAHIIEQSLDKLVVIVPEEAVEGPVKVGIPGPGYTRCGYFVQGVTFSNSINITGGSSVIHELRIEQNNQSVGWVEPGENVNVIWKVSPQDANVTLIIREPDGSVINSFSGLDAEGSKTIQVPSAKERRKLEVRLTVVGSCGSTVQTLGLPVDVKPELEIVAIEITQGIQRFSISQDGPNDVELIENKGTIVRAYITADRKGLDNDHVVIGGRLLINNNSLQPVNGKETTVSGGGDYEITARPLSELDRKITDHSLNFFIPASLAKGTETLRIDVWNENEVTGETRVLRTTTWTWQDERKLKIRWMRVRLDAHNLSRPSVSNTNYNLDRAMELLPSSNNDVESAPKSLYSSNRSLTGSTSRAFFMTGLRGRRSSLVNFHGMSSDAILAAMVPNLSSLSNSSDISLGQAFGSTVCWAQIHEEGDEENSNRRITTAHEFAHNLGYDHVNLPASGDNSPSGTEYHPNDGYLEEIPFDTHYNKTIIITDNSGNPTCSDECIGDFMSYYRPRRTSIYQWNRLRNDI